MLTLDDIARGRTLAQDAGMTREIGIAIAGLAAEELRAGRLEAARGILEGLVIVNPREATAWALLSQVERRQGRAPSALLCAEAASRLAPGDLQIRLVRAEALLAVPGQEAAARTELDALAGAAGGAGDRARQLRKALGNSR